MDGAELGGCYHDLARHFRGERQGGRICGEWGGKIELHWRIVEREMDFGITSIGQAERSTDSVDG